jgi:hypothetical protein
MDVLQSVEGLETSLEERGRTPGLNEVSDGRFVKGPLNVVSQIKDFFNGKEMGKFAVTRGLTVMYPN